MDVLSRHVNYKFIKEECHMLLCTVEELPLVLQANHIKDILGLSKGKTYELMNSSDFPTVYFGKRMVVPREAFFNWLAQDKRKIRRRAIIC
jgi:predicted DNA-binding transcriptional regulator AlpA